MYDERRMTLVAMAISVAVFAFQVRRGVGWAMRETSHHRITGRSIADGIGWAGNDGAIPIEHDGKASCTTASCLSEESSHDDSCTGCLHGFDECA